MPLAETLVATLSLDVNGPLGMQATIFGQENIHILQLNSTPAGSKKITEENFLQNENL